MARRDATRADATELRIIGGKFRGRKLRHEPLRIDDALVTRPMKHRVRESIFNLVGTAAEGTHAIDLFAGTGALGLEALSRGAARATFIEKHVPTARVIEQNIESLNVGEQATLLVTSAFLWGKRDAKAAGEGRDADQAIPSAFPLPPSPFGPRPWLVFCSPPYSFYVDRQPEMLELIARVQDAAPPESMLVVEADQRFEVGLLDDLGHAAWDVRHYPPAAIAVWRKPAMA